MKQQTRDLQYLPNLDQCNGIIEMVVTTDRIHVHIIKPYLIDDIL